MNAGLPGTGLGGLFYLISILIMCVKEAVHRIRGTGDRAKSRIALDQVLILVGALFSMWLTGLALHYLVRALSPKVGIGIEGMAKALPQAGLPLNALAVSAAVLGGLLLMVQLLRLVVRKPA